MTSTIWLTDRSRYKTGLEECLHKRFLMYHAFGTGIIKAARSVPLESGIATHAILATVLEKAKVDPHGAQERTFLNEAIREGLGAFKTLVEKAGWLDIEDSEEGKWVLQEQLTLVEGLVRGWVKVHLPILLQEFSIVDVEREELLPVDFGGYEIGQMGRPDFIARRKADGVLTLHDFKTTSSVDDNYIGSFRNSVQMAIGTAAVEARRGEPVPQYYVWALVKGGRNRFKKNGQEDGFKKQFSDFCYVKHVPGNPPISEPKVITTGYWADKTPVWTLPFPSPSEWLIDNLPQSNLWSHFVQIGPYDRQTHMIKQYLLAMKHHEVGWIKNLWKAYQLEEQMGWDNEVYQDLLTTLFPRSYDCSSYGSPCPFFNMCFRQDDNWRDPLGSGKYVRREPHHEPEMVQFKERGLL